MQSKKQLRKDYAQQITDDVKETALKLQAQQIIEELQKNEKGRRLFKNKELTK